MVAQDIELSLCTHIVYGYAILDPSTNRLKASDEYLDLESGRNNYREFTNLKRMNPGLKVLLSVGGPSENKEREVRERYLTLLRDNNKRTMFINSVEFMIKKYGFDGLDLAWPFYEEYKKERSTVGSWWHGFRRKIGAAEGRKDENPDENREGFTSLVRELRLALSTGNLLLTTSVLPLVNGSVYHDIRALSPYLDQIHLMTFDYFSPDRQKEEADYPAPLYKPSGREDSPNVDATVRSWLERGTQSSKLILGIPMYGRSWTLSGDDFTPPAPASGPGEPGPFTKQPGLLAYYEICTNITTVGGLKNIKDTSKKTGPFAYKVPQWVGYDDVDSVENKAQYVKIKGLGGIAFYDVSLDDFRGFCSGTRYPLLKTAKSQL